MLVVPENISSVKSKLEEPNIFRWGSKPTPIVSENQGCPLHKADGRTYLRWIGVGHRVLPPLAFIPWQGRVEEWRTVGSRVSYYFLPPSNLGSKRKSTDTAPLLWVKVKQHSVTMHGFRCQDILSSHEHTCRGVTWAEPEGEVFWVPHWGVHTQLPPGSTKSFPGSHQGRALLALHTLFPLQWRL